MNTTQSNSDNTATWVWGIKQPGWYMARWIWVEEYAEHLHSLGYQVIRSNKKPTGKPEAA